MKMKIAGLAAALILSCSMSALAQTSGTGDSQMKQDNMSSGMAKPMTTTGCISEKDGKYMLTNAAHPKGMELMSSEDMKPHVGQKMKITGMMENSAAASSNMKSDDNMGHDTMSHGNMGMAMKVTSMKMVSGTCASAMDKPMSQ